MNVNENEGKKTPGDFETFSFNQKEIINWNGNDDVIKTETFLQDDHFKDSVEVRVYNIKELFFCF